MTKNNKIIIQYLLRLADNNTLAFRLTKEVLKNNNKSLVNSNKFNFNKSIVGKFIINRFIPINAIRFFEKFFIKKIRNDYRVIKTNKDRYQVYINNQHYSTLNKKETIEYIDNFYQDQELVFEDLIYSKDQSLAKLIKISKDFINIESFKLSFIKSAKEYNLSLENGNSIDELLKNRKVVIPRRNDNQLQEAKRSLQLAISRNKEDLIEKVAREMEEKSKY